jgi:hypothetical protein
MWKFAEIPSQCAHLSTYHHMHEKIIQGQRKSHLEELEGTVLSLFCSAVTKYVRLGNL